MSRKRLRPGTLHAFGYSIADALRQAIVTGVLPDGSQLYESRLADELGVSTGVVREAIAELEEEGLVWRDPGRGAFVGQPGVEAFDDLVDVWCALETLAFERAAPILRRLGFDELEACVDRMKRSIAYEDAEMLAESELDFHGVFYQAARNPVLFEAWSGLERRIRSLLVQARRNADGARYFVDEHLYLLNLARAADPDHMRREVESHIRETLPAMAAARPARDRRTSLDLQGDR